LLIEKEEYLPASVKKWAQSSWKKYFIAYLVRENKFFVYPRTSLSTNFSTAGTHVKNEAMTYQVPLLAKNKQFRFSHLNKSCSVYDVFYELLPQCLKSLNSKLKELDFECDFYGSKALESVKSRYLIFIKECKSPIKSYSIRQLPQELNVVFDAEGNSFTLGEVSSFGGVNQKAQRVQFISLWKGIGMSRCWNLYFHFLFDRVRHKLKSIQARLA